MKKNLGTFDRLLRLGLGVVFLGLAFVYASWILAIVGVFCIWEALVSWCPFYRMLGKDTCNLK